LHNDREYSNARIVDVLRFNRTDATVQFLGDFEFAHPGRSAEQEQRPETPLNFTAI
jgi:hypothetical protein